MLTNHISVLNMFKMTTQALQLYEVLKNILNDSGAKALIKYLEECMEAMISKQIDTKVAHLATKEDLIMLESKMIKMMMETKAELLETKADLMKWMFIFIMGQTVAIAGLIKLFFQN